VERRKQNTPKPAEGAGIVAGRDSPAPARRTKATLTKQRYAEQCPALNGREGASLQLVEKRSRSSANA